MKNIGDTNIQILWGREGIKKAYEMSLEAKSLDIVCLSSDYEKIIGLYFDKEYAPRLFLLQLEQERFCQTRQPTEKTPGKKTV